MAEQIIFIPDKKPGMSVRDRNMQLSAELATAPLVNCCILKIVRLATGWEIMYL